MTWSFIHRAIPYALQNQLLSILQIRTGIKKAFKAAVVHVARERESNQSQAKVVTKLLVSNSSVLQPNGTLVMKMAEKVAARA